jgi:hypothetical protein
MSSVKAGTLPAFVSQVFGRKTTDRRLPAVAGPFPKIGEHTMNSGFGLR